MANDIKNQKMNWKKFSQDEMPNVGEPVLVQVKDGDYHAVKLSEDGTFYMRVGLGIELFLFPENIINICKITTP